MAAGQDSRDERQCSSGHQLPPENGADRPAQVAKHGVLDLRPKQSARSIAFEGNKGQFAAVRQGLDFAALFLPEPVEQRLELIEARVVDDELAAARFCAGPYAYGGAELPA